MNKLQAAMRDIAARRWKENRRYFKVGSCFKACMNCGVKQSWYDDEGVKHFGKTYVSGSNVFRSYKPKDIGWTYKCADCLFTDERCWKDAWDIGEEPRILPKSDISPFKGEQGVKQYTQGQYRKERRELAFPKETGANVPKERPLSDRERTIMALEAKVKELMAMVGGNV